MNDKVFHFYKHRRIFFAISALFFIIAIAALFINGIQLDIQFKGGSIIKYSYDSPVDLGKAEDIVEATLGKIANCQFQTNLARGEETLVVSLASNEALTTQEQKAVTDALNEAFPNSGLELSESLTVEPFIGAKFFRNGLIAITLSFVLILVYVGIRFRKIGGISAGVMAIIALIHDALIVTAVFIVFRIPLNDSFIAAILTIIGFSINDTIVIYDRIRENDKIMGRKTPIDVLVDTSITQSMSRSINTNIAVFVSITIVYIFAQIYNIESIKAFALPMMFGTISGCYSTICIAGPLWTMWKTRKKAKTRTA